MVTVLPNDLHDVFKLRASTGAWWTYLSDAELELQRALEIDEYTDTHHAATVPHTLVRSEEHTSELQSRQYLVCRLLLEKKHNQYTCVLLRLSGMDLQDRTNRQHHYLDSLLSY